MRLEDLDPAFSRLAIHSRFLNSGLILSTGSWLLYGLLRNTSVYAKASHEVDGLIALGIAGIFMTAVGIKKQKLVQFRTRAGVEALAVFNEGRRKQEFEPFVANLVSAINAAKK